MRLDVFLGQCRGPGARKSRPPRGEEDLLRIVGVVPAAGYARRLGPIQSSKEVLAIGGKPVMDYIFERMKRVPCNEIRVVTRRDKTDVIHHADSLGARVIFREPATIAESLLHGLDDLDDDDVVLLGFPDTIWEPLDGFLSLLSMIEKGADIVLGLFRMAEPQRSDVVDFDAAERVRSIHVKPKHPASDWIWGCFAARRGGLLGLRPDQEIGTFFDRLAREKEIVGIHLSDVFVDVGTLEMLRLYERLPYSAIVEVARYDPNVR